MDENEAVEEESAVATPIFSVYRRGYDPEQVDRYVLDQQRRLDEALHRSSESERKLAAAVGQLRELHRRVAVYESEARSAQPPQLDTLGERVQRILQEAWEGAYNLRQEAERDVTEMRESIQHEVESLRAQAESDVQELRDVASKEAAEVVDEATRRALHIRDETERRRQAYLERVERDREQAISQITYLYDQRQCAIAELARLQATVQATVEEMVRSPLGRPAPGVMEAAADGVAAARASGGGGGGAVAPQMPPMAPLPTALPAMPGGAPGRPAVRPVPQGQPLGAPRPMDPPMAEAPPIPGLDTPAPGPAPRASREVNLEIPTGPMERFVRPTDRDDARAASKHGPQAEADDMERVMRHSPHPPATPTAGPASDPPPNQQPEQAVMGLAEREGGGVLQSGREAASRILRRPRQQGVYDAEQDGWT
jgi:hypothetical protein